MIKLLYKPVGLLVSILGGVLARALFGKVWKIATGDRAAPRPTDAGRGWLEVLAAAGVQGAVFAVVQAALDRAAAAGTRRLTGTWPGEEEGQEA